MTIYGWDVVPAKRRMPASGQTVNGEPFTVPKGARALTLSVPTLAGGGDTVKLQALVFPENDQVSESWQDLATFNLAGGAVVALSGIPSAATTTIPATATGAGVLRCVASADQSASPVNILITILTED